MRLDKQGTPEAKAIKLLLNSMYGKFAQSVGAAPYRNWVYASLITSGCRAKILDAIATHPEGTKAVAMIATDAVFFTSPHPGLSYTDALGDWKLKIHSNLNIFKPGAYWDDRAREDIKCGVAPIFKARGINAKGFAKHLSSIDDLFRAFAIDPTADTFPSITYSTDFALTTCKLALGRRKWWTAGQVKSCKVNQSSNPVHKRTGVYWDEVASVVRTRPYDVAETLTSKGYSSHADQRETREALEDFDSGTKDGLVGYETPDGPWASLLFGAMGTGAFA